MNQLVDRIRRGLQQPLPGHDAFLELSGYKRPDLERARQLEPPPQESAVLVLLYPKDTLPHLLLMVRPTYDGVHSAQVSFPGGKREAGDWDLRQTALREFAEETGASTADVEVLGSLTPVYIPPSRSLVTPYVAFQSHAGVWRPNPREVDRLMEVPVTEVLRPTNLRRKEQYIHMMQRNVEVPYYHLDGETVWGATAMMIAELGLLLHDPQAGH